jgi:glycosyltransferase involved in cell wall biosynthesis
VIVGGAPYAEEYIKRLKSTKDTRVKFPGFVFGEDYRALQQNAYCYVHATEVGGTHPALIEAMGAGNCALVLNTPENLEVMGDAGIAYDSVDDLAEKMRQVLADPSLISEYRRRAMERVRAFYNWEQITDQYDLLLATLAGLEVPAEPLPLLAREARSEEVKALAAYPFTALAESEVSKTTR